MSDYYYNLRKHIGTAPILVPVAGVIVHKGKQILLQRRSDNGSWAIHGGVLDLGESVEEAAARELKEEIGITPLDLTLYGVFSGEDLHIVYPDGNEVYCVCIVFLCDEYEGIIKACDGEVAELKWFDVDNLPANISPVDKIILRDIDPTVRPVKYPI